MPAYDGGNIYEQIKRITLEGIHDKEYLARKAAEQNASDTFGTPYKKTGEVLVVRNNPGDSENKVKVSHRKNASN